MTSWNLPTLVWVVGALAFGACADEGSPMDDVNAAAGSGGGAAAAGASDPDEGASANAALSGFIDAFTAGDYDSVGDHIAALDVEVEDDPEDATAVLFSALARMWQVGEAARVPDFDLAKQAPIALAALDRFEQAHELDPDDGRILSWIGFMKTRIGEAIQSADMIADGKTDLDAAVKAFPTFTHFVRGIVLVGRPHDDPEFDQAPEDMWAVLEACGYDVDREHPSFDYPEEAGEYPRHICQDTGTARHNWKGFFLHAGDIFSKAGDAATATAMWEHSRKSPTYDTWKFKSALEDRIESAEMRTKLLTDDDPENDPELWAEGANVCVACHVE